MEEIEAAEELARDWRPYESGATLGKRGPARGNVLRDEEYGDPDEPEDADARVTLESLAPESFAVTANLYGGWLHETATQVSESTADAVFDAAKAELARLAALIPDEDDRDIAGRIAPLNAEVAAFVARFGGSPTL